MKAHVSLATALLHFEPAAVKAFISMYRRFWCHAGQGTSFRTSCESGVEVCPGITEVAEGLVEHCRSITAGPVDKTNLKATLVILLDDIAKRAGPAGCNYSGTPRR